MSARLSPKSDQKEKPKEVSPDEAMKQALDEVEKAIRRLEETKRLLEEMIKAALKTA